MRIRPPVNCGRANARGVRPFGSSNYSVSLRDLNTRGTRSFLGQLGGCIGGTCGSGGVQDAATRIAALISSGCDVSWSYALLRIVRTQELKARIVSSHSECRNVVGDNVDSVALRASYQQIGSSQRRSVAHYTQNRPRPVRAIPQVRERQVAAPDLVLRAREGVRAAGWQIGRRRQFTGGGWLSGVNRRRWPIFVEDAIDSIQRQVAKVGAVCDGRYVSIAEERVTDTVRAIVCVRVFDGRNLFTGPDGTKTFPARALPVEGVLSSDAFFLARAFEVLITEYSVFHGIHRTRNRLTKINLDIGSRRTEGAGIATRAAEQQVKV